MGNDFEVLIIGAGQSGLAMGYYLQQRSRSFLIMDAQKRIGDSWRNRYDSLILFTPRSFSQLPGLPLPGDTDGLPDKDEVADYLEQYAAFHSLPVKLETPVTRLTKTDTGFKLEANGHHYFAKEVVITTGPFHQPFVPAFGNFLSPEVYQLHTAVYKNPSQLREGSVLVVGAGNSGAQIAVELAAEHDVILSMGAPRKFLPLSIFSKNIFWYFAKTGLLHASVDTRLGLWLSKQPDPIFGYGKEIKSLIRDGKIKLATRTVSADGKVVAFADGTSAEVNNIIWGTGFKPDYDWIEIAGVFDRSGKPLHKRGKSRIDGLYFLGLPWQYRRGSALIGGVGEDAQFLAELICT